jgi:hypothetical protein
VETFLFAGASELLECPDVTWVSVPTVSEREIACLYVFWEIPRKKLSQFD